MQRADNPYASPDASGELGSLNSEEIEFRVVAQLEATRPWLLILAVTLVLAGVLSILFIISLLMLVIMDPWPATTFSLVTAGIVAGVFAPPCIVAAKVVLIVRSLVQKYVETRQLSWLEQAARAQSGFWQLCGYSAAIVTGIILIATVCQMLT